MNYTFLILNFLPLAFVFFIFLTGFYPSLFYEGIATLWNLVVFFFFLISLHPEVFDGVFCFASCGFIVYWVCLDC